MHDTTLFCIAVSVSLLGLILLVLVSFLSPEIREMNYESVDGEKMRLRAAISGVSHRGNISVLTLSSTCFMDAIIFEQVNLTEKDCVLVSGSKSTYDGKPQLIVDKIVLC